MVVLVDAGNSHLKWATLDNGRLGVAPQPEPHVGRAPDAVFGAAWAELPAPHRIVGSCVAGSDFQCALAEWAQRHWGLVPEWIAAGAQGFGVRNAYRQPEQLGSDRWAALIGAHAHPQVSGACCIVDCGSAVTVDGMRADGQHLGGWIAPGRGMMTRSLLQHTADLGERAQASGEAGREEAPAEALAAGETTRRCIENGSLLAITGFIERAVDALASQAGADLQCLICGGDAPRVLPLLRREFRYEPDLVLQGLAVIAAEPDSDL